MEFHHYWSDLFCRKTVTPYVVCLYDFDRKTTDLAKLLKPQQLPRESPAIARLCSPVAFIRSRTSCVAETLMTLTSSGRSCGNAGQTRLSVPTTYRSPGNGNPGKQRAWRRPTTCALLASMAMATMLQRLDKPDLPTRGVLRQTHAVVRKSCGTRLSHSKPVR
jgi:hypothetical protein